MISFQKREKCKGILMILMWLHQIHNFLQLLTNSRFPLGERQSFPYKTKVVIRKTKADMNLVKYVANNLIFLYDFTMFRVFTITGCQTTH